MIWGASNYMNKHKESDSVTSWNQPLKFGFKRRPHLYKPPVNELIGSYQIQHLNHCSGYLPNSNLGIIDFSQKLRHLFGLMVKEGSTLHSIPNILVPKYVKYPLQKLIISWNAQCMNGHYSLFDSISLGSSISIEVLWTDNLKGCLACHEKTDL